MKNLLVLALAAAISSSVYALDWTDTQSGTPLKTLYGTNGDSRYESTFNILDNGYNPATMIITSATVSFAFADGASPDAGEELINIFMNGGLTPINAAPLEVDGTHQSPPGTYDFRTFSLNDTAGLIAALQDGQISFRVQLTNGGSGGDTYLKIASLTATGTSRTVPDGGTTAVMLGLGLIGLAAIRKRFSL